MKNKILYLGLLLAITACNSKDKAPDVSHINVDVKIERFDQAFFSIDTNNLEIAFSNLNNRFPAFTLIFVQNILGLDQESMSEGVKRFIRQNKFLEDTVVKVFPDLSSTQNEFKSAFKYIKYYFPEYKLPGIITIVGPPDALAKTVSGEPSPNFIGPGFLGISLQFYLGKDFSLYKDPLYISNIAPEFRSRRFDKKYLVADAMKIVVDDIYPDKSIRMGLVEQMIEKGKQWWLLDKFMPYTEDSIKTGYTGDQLDWCNEYEGLIWNEIITTEKDIYTKDPITIQNYIGDAPFTQSLSPSSPGNIGQWIGWQIVKKFVSKNPSMGITEILNTEPRKILEIAKYKPK